MKKESGESSDVVSQTDVKGLLEIVEVKLQSPTRTKIVLALCDSTCSNSWISDRLLGKLHVQGTAIKLKVHGINSQEVVETEMVQLKLTIYTPATLNVQCLTSNCMSESTLMSAKNLLTLSD